MVAGVDFDENGKPVIPAGRLILVRHGETEWSRSGQHTGLTDLPLLPEGEAAARATKPVLDTFNFVHVRVSPLHRAQRTAELVGLTPDLIDENLREWDYGGYEGVTTKDIRERTGYLWNVFEHGVIPGDTPGETVEEVAGRASRVLEEIYPHLHDGDVALVGHGHCLRILAGVYLRQNPRWGRRVTFETGALAVLGHHHEDRVIEAWNRKR